MAHPARPGYLPFRDIAGPDSPRPSRTASACRLQPHRLIFHRAPGGRAWSTGSPLAFLDGSPGCGIESSEDQENAVARPSAGAQPGFVPSGHRTGLRGNLLPILRPSAGDLLAPRKISSFLGRPPCLPPRVRRIEAHRPRRQVWVHFRQTVDPPHIVAGTRSREIGSWSHPGA